MVTLPAVSSRECVRVLRRIGFHTVDDIDGAHVLERGNRRVCIPPSNIIDPEPLLAILREAGVPVMTFLDDLGMLEAG
jgi:predicted RNA binding protein YcfA (HicA-like mRNA interferase family)